MSTLLVLENDLYERGPAAQVSRLLKAFKQVLLVDALETRTAAEASVVLASGSALESEGTVVNLQGRAQRYYPVFQPRGESFASWQWLLRLLQATQPQWEDLQHFDEVTARCAEAHALLAGIAEAGPGRSTGQRIPRQPQRYSGRTALTADQSVHEPQQPKDPETPLTYSMEGFSSAGSDCTKPFVWAPGWNSNHAVHKFQEEIGGALRGDAGGVLLFGDKPEQSLPEPAAAPPSALHTALDTAPNMALDAAPEMAVDTAPDSAADAAPDTDKRWLLLPRPLLFGSESRSAMSSALRELVPAATVTLSPAAAEQLGVDAGDGVQIAGAGQPLEVRIDADLPEGYAAYAHNFPACRDLLPGKAVQITRAEHWRRADADLIARSGSRHA